MTKSEIMLDIIGDVQDEYIENVDKRIATVKSRKRIAATSLAAMFMVAITALFLLRSDFAPDIIGANASYGVTGVTSNGYFYYEVPSKGIYRYSPEEKNKKLVDLKIFDSWYEYTINDRGLYYTADRNIIHRIDHNSDKPVKIYESEKAYISNLYPFTATDISVKLNYKNAINHEEIVIDGVTGKENTILYSEAYDEKHSSVSCYIADEIVYTVGDRTISVIKSSDGTYSITEDGKELFDIDIKIFSVTPVYTANDYIIFVINSDYRITSSVTIHRYLIVRSDSNDSHLIFNSPCPPQGNDKYFFSINDDGHIECADTYTNEKTTIANNKQFDYSDLYSDGKYIYVTDHFDTTAPIVCYEIIYDSDKKPYDIKLIDNNIMK